MTTQGEPNGQVPKSSSSGPLTVYQKKPLAYSLLLEGEDSWLWAEFSICIISLWCSQSWEIETEDHTRMDLATEFNQ